MPTIAAFTAEFIGAVTEKQAPALVHPVATDAAVKRAPWEQAALSALAGVSDDLHAG